MFCRTLEDRAKRLFSTKGKPVENLDPSLFSKAARSSSTTAELNDYHKEVAFLEAQVYQYAEMLSVSSPISKLY